MNIEATLRVTEIQRFCMHDGPGLRTTVFLKGCPLRCAWCHNPETQRAAAELLFYPNQCMGCGSCVAACTVGACTAHGDQRIDRETCRTCAACVEVCPTGALELCGKGMTVEEVLAVVEKDGAFYGEQGGITLSGGEPLAHREGTVALLKACKARGLHTAVETCGYADADILRAVVPLVDLFLWDIKDTCEERHRAYTGVSNRRILENLALADALGARVRLRCILVKGVNTDDDHYRRIGEIAAGLSACEGVELIPYHAYGGTKTVFLGGEDSGRVEWIPSEEECDRARRVIREAGGFVIS